MIEKARKKKHQKPDRNFKKLLQKLIWKQNLEI